MYVDCSCWISSVSSRRSTRAIRSRTKRIVSSLFAVTENLPVSTVLFAAKTDSPFGRSLFTRPLSDGNLTPGIEPESHSVKSCPQSALRLADMAIIAEFGPLGHFLANPQAASRRDALPGEGRTGSPFPHKGIC